MSTASLVEVKTAPSPAVIDALEKLLERARSGELRGLVALLNLGTNCDNLCAGATGLTDVLVAFEDWKFQQLAHRNLTKTE